MGPASRLIAAARGANLWVAALDASGGLVLGGAQLAGAPPATTVTPRPAVGTGLAPATFGLDASLTSTVLATSAATGTAARLAVVSPGLQLSPLVLSAPYRLLPGGLRAGPLATGFVGVGTGAGGAPTLFTLDGARRRPPGPRRWRRSSTRPRPTPTAPWSPRWPAGATARWSSPTPP